MPDGAYAPGTFFFRGGASGTGNGVQVDISGDPPCAYRVDLQWLARHWLDTTVSTEILYCKTS